MPALLMAYDSSWTCELADREDKEFFAFSLSGKGQD